MFSGHLQLFHLNFRTITLLPKKTEAVRIEKFRPICLLNVSFKIFTKVGTNRLTQIVHSVVQLSQTAFMPDQNILKGVVVLHEMLHEIHTKKLDGVVFKVVFEGVRQGKMAISHAGLAYERIRSGLERPGRLIHAKRQCWNQG